MNTVLLKHTYICTWRKSPNSRRLYRTRHMRGPGACWKGKGSWMGPGTGGQAVKEQRGQAVSRLKSWTQRPLCSFAPGTK